MKKLFLAPIFAAVVLAGGIVWFYLMVQPVSNDKTLSNFLIAKGSSATQIGNKLKNAGFIKNALAFKIYVQFSGKSSSIPTGEFRLSPSFSLFQIVDQLIRGPAEIWVTIPEGYRKEEVAERFSRNLDKSGSFISEFLSASRGKEGMLFPDTYLFPKEASAAAVVNKMIKNFTAKTSNLTTSADLTFAQRVVLASIIERETKTDAERSIVAGIIMNRLNLGMAIQVDATVQYAVASASCVVDTKCNWWPVLSREDLKINSPYNTYKFSGLPPTPISNPGLSSLNAAFNPTKSDYLYYIHDAEGQIHYARTLEEQNANIQKYLR